jgi:hypothetical protein
MNITEAVNIIQNYADAQDVSFDEQMFKFSRAANKISSTEIYDAFIVVHTMINKYFSQSANEKRVKELAQAVKNLQSANRALFDSLT